MAERSAKPSAIGGKAGGTGVARTQRPDFAMLRAALAAAQAATPTGIAGRAAPAKPRTAEMLARIFADGASEPAPLGPLRGSFHPVPGPDGAEGER